MFSGGQVIRWCMARKAFRCEVLCSCWRRVMRVVARRAVKRAAALGVAAAPWKGRALKPDPELISARQ